ncbi:cytosolic beta-glucosidase-like [Liolophura sinensis]|uniref:cytosolic beta-glucosidase-like n=1 Tax=Liolophura sinensis TaxID=3198878 RepID=UPI0031589BC5
MGISSSGTMAASCVTTILLLGIRAVVALQHEEEFFFGDFPPDFMWGIATGSYQIEGAWNEDGKGPSIWDTFSHEGKNYNNDTGDVACDSYHKWEEDVANLKRLGVKHYRFSISWPRVLPDGTTAQVNQKGIEYYNNLINAVRGAGIKPMVVLYHWDLPQALQDAGGWLNESIVDRFNDYARFCFKTFGDRVPFWVTFIEPWSIIWLGYGNGIFAPGIQSPAEDPYIAGHNMILSHVQAFHTYKNEFYGKFKGKVGITADLQWKFPKTQAPRDQEAAERAAQFKLGWFLNPIYGSGDYPDVMKERVANKSKAQGYTKSRLPPFTADQIRMNKGSGDFVGINHYSSQLISDHPLPLFPPSYESDQDLLISLDPKWKGLVPGDWLKSVPVGIRKLLNWVKSQYNNPLVYITENGVDDPTGELDDQFRVGYIRNYTNEVLKAIRLDSCNVKGYTVWTLMDDFEWSSGYRIKFGLHYVNFSDPSRPRTPKASSKFYASLIRNNGYDSTTTTVVG